MPSIITPRKSNLTFKKGIDDLIEIAKKYQPKEDKEEEREEVNSPEEVEQETSEEYILIPSINLNVAKQRTYLGKNWFECHKLLQSNNQRMLTIPEFIEVLKYTKTNYQEIYNDITEVRNPWRAEWLDADFKTKGDNLEIRYNHKFNSDGNIIHYDSEILDKNTLMKDKKISLEDWLNNPTSQGFPTNKINSGNFSYWHPRRDNNSVARFFADDDGAGLNCGRSSSGRNSILGVRAVGG